MRHNNVLREMNIRSCFGTVCAAAPAATDSEQCASSLAHEYSGLWQDVVRREVRLGYAGTLAIPVEEDNCDKVKGKTRNNMVIGHRLPYDMVGKHVKSAGKITARQIAVMQHGIADAMQRCPRLFTGLFPLGPRLEYYNHTRGLSVFDVLHGDSAYYPTLQHTDTMEVAVRGGLRRLQIRSQLGRTSRACERIHGFVADSLLNHLDLSYARLGSRQVRLLTSGLSGVGVGLVSLKLAECRIGRRGAAMLAKGWLRGNTTLRKLQLCGNKLRSQGAKTLLVALHGHPALTQLSLRTNLLHDSVARFVAALLDSSPITDLDLSDNKLGSKGVNVMAQAGAKLEELDVGGAVKVRGSSKLFLASVRTLGRTCVNLSELTLDCIVLKDKGAAALASGVIPVANALTSLSVQCCEIGDKGMCDLIRAVGAHDTLVLRACGNKGTHKMARLIAAHFRRATVCPFWVLDNMDLCFATCNDNDICELFDALGSRGDAEVALAGNGGGGGSGGDAETKAAVEEGGARFQGGSGSERGAGEGGSGGGFHRIGL